MLNIAHLSPAYFSPDSYVGGGERYVDYIAQALQGIEGITQTIFSTGPDDQLFSRHGIPFRVLRNESPHAGMTNAFSSALWNELSNFDLVHIHQCLTLFGAYSTAIVRSKRIPIVGTDLGGGEDSLMMKGRCIELMSGVVSISRYAHNLTAGFYHGPHEILIGPIDTDRFIPAQQPALSHQRALCVSRILPHKGIDRILAALPPDFSLVIAGRVYHEPYYDLLRRMAEGKDVTFILDADDDKLLDLYHSSSIFIQASTAKDIYGTNVAKPELMGLTTLEAMSCGLPVIVSDAGSLPELVPDPRFGRVFSGVDHLASILHEVSCGAWPNSNASNLARMHAVAHHGFLAIGTRLAAFYRSVLAQN